MIGVRPTVAADSDLLLEIFAASRADFAFLPLPPDAKNQLIAQQHRAQLSHYAAAYPGAQYLVVEADGAPVGELIVWQNASQLRIVDIALLPAHRSRGIGTVLIRRLQDQARLADLRLQLAVWASNDAAVHFYRQLGFEQTSDDAGYLDLTWQVDRAQDENSYQRREVG